MDAVVASSLEIEQKHLLIDFIQSYAPLEESQRRDLNELLVDPKRENTMNFRKTMMQEAMELGLSQGLEKGLSQGLEKGLSQGLEKGQRLRAFRGRDRTREHPLPRQCRGLGL